MEVAILVQISKVLDKIYHVLLDFYERDKKDE